MLDGLTELGYLGLFLASFLAATVLPFSSEAVFVALVAAGLDLNLCLFYATLGNALGGATCYYVGRMGRTGWLEKYFRIKREKIDQTQRWLQGKGAAMGFFGFMPVVGDAILVALGFMRANVATVMCSMTLGKFARYLLIALGSHWLARLF